jgi:ATP-binding cassette subfamily F protein 3
MGFEFLKPARTGRTVVEMEGLRLSAGGKPLLESASLVIERGEHVALVGPNGSGKTTLLETLVGHREPDAGVVRVGHSVQPAYFSQHDVELDERGSVVDCAVAMTGLARPQAQSLLGKFLFSGYAEQDKAVSVLSGGERRRLSLAVVVASGANFLVLDEPTNHLDLESREALEAALEAFPGAILLVSHDRALLDAVAERTVAIEGRTLRSYDGGWADLVQAREEAAVPPEVVERPPKEPKQPSAPKPVRRAPTELEQVERRIATLEERVAQLEAKLAEDWTNMDTLTEYRTSRDELQSLLARWEVLFETA